MRRLLIVAIGAGLLAWRCGSNEQSGGRQRSEGGAARTDTSSARDTARGEARPSTDHLIDRWEMEELREQGLADPVPQIVADLQAHPELIPHPGTLGGQMGFYAAREIHVLDSKWVYAVFTDGHIQGCGLFEFAIKQDSSLSWRVIASRVDEP
jgi:hypothetical protein